MSLVNCLKKAGKSISKGDADTILQKRDELIAKGMDEAEADSIALTQAEEAIQGELDEILTKSGKPLAKDVPEGVPIEFNDKMYDSNQFISDIDNELNGIDQILGCLYK